MSEPAGRKPADEAAVTESDPARIRAEVGRVFDSYAAAFTRLDAPAVARHFCVPSIMSSNDGYIVWNAREQVLANMVALCDLYRAHGFVAARYELLEVIPQPPAHAFAHVRWIIRRHHGLPSLSFRTSYSLRRDVQDWRVLLCTAYEESRQETL